MNYLGLIAVCLGILAVFITLQQMNSNEKLRDDLSNIRTKCIDVNKHNKQTTKLVNIKDESGLSLNEIQKLISEYKSKITSKINKEGFTNYDTGTLDKKNTDLIYSSAQSRGIIMDKDYLKKHIDYNRINELKHIVSGYQDLFEKTFQRVLSQDKTNKLNNNEFQMEEQYKKNKDLKALFSKTKDLKTIFTKTKGLVKNRGTCANIPRSFKDSFKQWCKVKYEGKNYCFKVPMKELCKFGKIGEMVNTSEGCDYY